MAEQTMKNEKKTLREWCSEHPKTVFSIRLAVWALFSAILPFIFIAWRYGIFTSQSKIKLSGWGLIAAVILIVFAITLVKYLSKGMKQCLLKQCIVGFCKIIVPLVIILFFVLEIKNSLELIAQALGCVILCELISIPLNPLPDWLEHRRIEEGKQQADTLFDLFWDKFFKKKKDSE